MIISSGRQVVQEIYGKSAWSALKKSVLYWSVIYFQGAAVLLFMWAGIMSCAALFGFN